MFFFTYKTTNLVNGKYYFGRHSTETLEDGYLGSGVALKGAILKYGRNNFKRDIIELFESYEAVIEGEIKLVTEVVVADKMSYNVNVGGCGGSTSRDWTPERIKKASEARIGGKRTPESKKRMSESAKGRTFSEDTIKKMVASRVGIPSSMKGKTHSEDTRRKMSESHRNRKRKPFSAETKIKLSEAAKRRWALKRAELGD